MAYLKERFQWRILDSYIFKKFLGTFVYAIVLLMVIVIVFDISENIQRFMDKNISFSDIIFRYYLNFIPYFINLFIPLFTFISVIWFTSKLSSQNEIISILNGGISFSRFLLPYVSGALIIALLSLILSNFIVPYTQEHFLAFKNEMSNRHYITQSSMHIKNSPNSYIYLERWEEETREGYMFTYEILAHQNISYKISARTVKYNEEIKKWELKNYTKRTIIDGDEIITTGQQMDTVFNVLPRDFDQDVKIIETMTFRQLYAFIKQEESKGSSLVKYYIIEKHKRLANPLGTLIMTLLGQSVASRKTRRGVGVHLFLGIGLAFSFIFFQQISTVFSISGGLPPWLGSWIPNLIFLAICAVMLRFSQK
ncbi:MAG: LptF/LptG family permease [Bacteroidales bacterium]|jgi:lipopolysaccharide export system permease protein|nr:LptF/LptG family permease [Bacteroidales bacterium]